MIINKLFSSFLPSCLRFSELCFWDLGLCMTQVYKQENRLSYTECKITEETIHHRNRVIRQNVLKQMPLKHTKFKRKFCRNINITSNRKQSKMNVSINRMQTRGRLINGMVSITKSTFAQDVELQTHAIFYILIRYYVFCFSFSCDFMSCSELYRDLSQKAWFKESSNSYGCTIFYRRVTMLNITVGRRW